MGLCLGLRDQDQEGALVAMITQVAGTAGLHSSIVDYLETVAIIGGLAFFPQQHRVPLTLHRIFIIRSTTYPWVEIEFLSLQ